MQLFLVILVFFYLLVWYSFMKCLDCNRILHVCWPSLIFPQQCLDQAKQCAQRHGLKTKQTGLSEQVCQSWVQCRHTGLREDSYLDGERAAFPWNELLRDESLVWAPQMTRDPVCICAGGEPWSWAICLPAGILGSRTGVARQDHHFTLECFAFGVKRDPQMSRHCHSSNLSPKEFQSWTAGGSSCSSALSCVSMQHTEI